jgi:dehydrogenase/reductase SDR family member 12
MNAHDLIPRVLDATLDFLVAPGYSSIGYRARRRYWVDPPADRLAGRSVIVTGGNSGIGEATCALLYRAGANVHLVARNAERGDAARRRVLAAGGSGSVELWLCDVADLDDVRRFAAVFLEDNGSLDALVHNAGVLTGERNRSPQGHELTFATHVLGPFGLTSLLLPALRNAPDPRVLFVASGGALTAAADLGDPQLERRDFDGARFYAHAKRLQLLLAAELERREPGSGVSYSSLHPGWVDTPGLEASLPGFHRIARPFLRDAGQGANTAVWLLGAPAARQHPGAFWHDRRPRAAHRVPWTRGKQCDGPRLLEYLSELALSGQNATSVPVTA